jgi:predicted transcriptional regulator
MSKIEQHLKEAAEKSILKIITDGGWIQPDYANRLKLPQDLVNAVWSMVDQDALKQRLKERIERELADRVVNHIAAELATDIKQILSIPERREAIRALAREHMESIMAKGETK